MHTVVHATAYGVGLVALTEGLLGGLAFWVLGLPTPVLWGTVIAMMAFLPVLGASAVWAPAAVMLAFQGATMKAILLTVWGVVFIGFLTDYVLRTYLIGKGTQLHVLLVFFSVLGGIGAFGLVGIVAGPMIMATGLALIESTKPEPPQTALA
jgi:predicted PurR-regulated permease PerM